MLKPWITNDILKKCDEKNKLLKQIKDESDPDLLATFRQQYKHIRTMITNEKRANKKHTLPRNLWKIKITLQKLGKKLNLLLT